MRDLRSTLLFLFLSVLWTHRGVRAQTAFPPPPLNSRDVPTKQQQAPQAGSTPSTAGAAARALSEPAQRNAAPRRGRNNSRLDGDEFPPLPPDPYAQSKSKLPPLDQELWQHGGSYLYTPEGDRLNWPAQGEGHYSLLRLPEDWQSPQPPVTAFSEFLGTDPILPNPALSWFGIDGYAWDPRFVLHGRYELFGFALEQNNQDQQILGHQLLLDMDLRLTGTERFHVQFRPLGRRNTGGSFYQFSDPQGYVDNSHAEPDRYWFEFELHSVLGAYVDPNLALDYHTTVGRVPLTLHNDLLINDEMHAVAISKNNLIFGNLSNLNVQTYYAFNDVSAFDNSDASLYGVNLFADYQKIFYEASYSFLAHDFDSTRDSHYFAVSRTQLIGHHSFAMRALFKQGDSGGRGSGQLFTLEGNSTRLFDHKPLGIEKAVFFVNAFAATSGWNSIARANFNRLRTAFEVNPLVRISAGNQMNDTWGIAMGAQLFRDHEDESWIPELAFEQPEGEPVFGIGLRYLRKVTCRSFIELLGVYNESSDSRYDRLGVFGTYSILF